MKPEKSSNMLLGMTRSKAKMYEYEVPEESHIKITDNLAKLFPLAIGLLGEYAACVNDEEINLDYLSEIKKSLLFSAHFFDSYLEAKFEQDIDLYLIILGSASYYLSDLPGSSMVLAKKIDYQMFDFDCEGLEYLLHWLLLGDWSSYLNKTTGLYGKHISSISQSLVAFLNGEIQYKEIVNLLKLLKEFSYQNGTPRQLLFSDIISAVVRRRIENSTWQTIPTYSHLSLETWKPILKKKSFIKELWPSQKLLGEHGIFNGKSAVIQMPTSSGKTKATEIVIRSAFLSGRTDLAVIVAPFRALCHDIKDDLTNSFRDEDINIEEFSDVFQKDFDPLDFTNYKHVIVVTPEKLLYVIRQDPTFATKIGLLIYDEGHQFDSGSRGITYELLLASLKLVIPTNAQTLLISAVISNAESINDWLNEDVDSTVVSGNNLNSTYRSIAFASWIDRLGRLEFINPQKPEEEEFYVPRTISQVELKLKQNERKKRYFPQKQDTSISLFLGLKLVHNGSIAIFCGTKNIVSSLCSKIMDAYERGLTFKKPLFYSDAEEIKKIYAQYVENLGEDSSVTKAAKIGILTHYNNIPHGIRLSVEFAMKLSKAKFIICTSTLAQGVNLPLKYLIIASTQQGQDPISVRDFHNLLGRAGRAGMYTEGSIIFANNSIYDAKKSDEGKRRWEATKKILNPQNSEPCISTLYKIFDPIHNGKNYSYGKKIIMEPLEFAQKCISGQIDAYIEEILNDLGTIVEINRKNEKVDVGFKNNILQEQVQEKIDILYSIENYILSHVDYKDSEIEDDYISELAKKTLAYSLADEKQKQQILDLFKLLAENIKTKIPDLHQRKVFGKTLYGLETSLEIEKWIDENINELVTCNNSNELIDIIWPILFEMIKNTSFKKCNNKNALKEIIKNWIAGKPFYKLLEIITKYDAKLIANTQLRELTIDNIVDICENGLAYDGSLLIGAITEIITSNYTNVDDNFISDLNLLQKQLKYGITEQLSITIYELGFADRIIATKLSNVVKSRYTSKKSVLKSIKFYENDVRTVLNDYPSYFSDRLETLIM